MVAPVLLTNSFTESCRAPSFRPLTSQLRIGQLRCAIWTGKGPLFEQNKWREAKGRPAGATDCSRKHICNVDQTGTHVLKSSNLVVPNKLKASGCRHSSTMQEILAYRGAATTDYYVDELLSLKGGATVGLCLSPHSNSTTGSAQTEGRH